MNKKFAFTLSELLICMGIIGVISTVGYRIFRDFDKGIRYIYSNTYHALDRALYNAINVSDLADPFEKIVNDNGEPKELSSQDGAKRLCEALTYYISTVDKNCDATLVNVKGDTFDEPHFVASNGVTFYISERMQKEESKNSPVFYIVFADINGTKKPNSMKYVAGSKENHFRTTDPDIFAFAALDIGRVCPLGPPEYDPRYMMTRISYDDVMTINDDGKETSESVVRYTSNSKPYYISKAEAWGYYLDTEKDPEDDSEDNPEQEQTQQPLADDAVLEDYPYSYNGYIRSVLPEDTLIYSFLKGNTPRAPKSVSIRDDIKCSKPSDTVNGVIHCDVIVDRYTY